MRGNPPPADQGRGTIAVLTAGTSDIPVAEEAAVTAELAGHRVDRVFDVGVAGLHRVLAHRATIEAAEIVIVAAGMDGVLPTVVAGLFSRPVIAVPTSVGYGVSLGGISAPDDHAERVRRRGRGGQHRQRFWRGTDGGDAQSVRGPPMKRVQQGLHLHFDPLSGIAGDMTVAALVDVGVPRAVIAMRWPR